MEAREQEPPLATPSSGAVEGDRVIADRYRVIRKLGEGGMGAVFLAEHLHIRKRVALKVLLPSAVGSPEIVARFEREAIAAGNIDHPGVCAATDFGRLPDGSYFLVLEYVDGQSLRSLVGLGAMPPARAVGIARQVLAALAAAHAKGVVHRDIKPENVMISTGVGSEDVVKVLDFGIAKLTDEAPTSERREKLTRLGAIYGTPEYMAPEQAMGQPIDHRADLYALGVMLHEMIAGAPPFDGDGLLVLARHVHDAPPALCSPLGPSVVSPALAAFVARLLAKRPDYRPESALQAIAELDHAGDLPPPPPPPKLAPSPRERLEAALDSLAARLHVPRRRLLIALAGLAAIVTLAMAIALLRSPSRADDLAADDDTSVGRDLRPIFASAEESPSATPSASTSASAAAASSSATGPASANATPKKTRGGAFRSLGRKIKGLF